MLVDKLVQTATTAPQSVPWRTVIAIPKSVQPSSPRLLHSSVYRRVWYNSDSVGGASAVTPFLSPAGSPGVTTPANSSATWRISLLRLAMMSFFSSSKSSAERLATGARDGAALDGVMEREDLERCLHSGEAVSAPAWDDGRVRLIDCRMSLFKVSMHSLVLSAWVLRSSRSSYLRKTGKRKQNDDYFRKIEF